MKQDYAILLVALTIMGAGITDGLVRAFDLSVWVALPLVAALWAAFAYTAYQQTTLSPPRRSGGRSAPGPPWRLSDLKRRCMIHT
jgi:uncharacterized membrane-anchored protein